MKTCTICKQSKELAEFAKTPSRKDGVRGFCKACAAVNTAKWRQANPETTKEYAKKHASSHRDKSLQKRFGITLTQYQELSNGCKHLCFICKQPESVKNRSLAVDHSHITGKIRGLLCGKCNQALGLFKDSIDLLNAAIAYLEASNNK